MLVDEKDPQVRELYVDVLARLDDPAAVSALARTAIEDSDLEIRVRAVDHLRNNGRHQAAVEIAPLLSSKNNQLVNRAAATLGRLGDPEVVLPLIDALITQHETVVQPSSNIRPSFGGSSDGSAGFNGLSVGGGPQKVARQLKNKSVLEALIALTKQNFQYAEDEWKQWYIHEHSPSLPVSLRRDP